MQFESSFKCLLFDPFCLQENFMNNESDLDVNFYQNNASNVEENYFDTNTFSVLHLNMRNK